MPDALPEGWSEVDGKLHRELEFKNFVEAFGFMGMVALLAEKADHHPDLDIRWRKVKVALSTHSEGGLTNRDFDLASEIEGLGG